MLMNYTHDLGDLAFYKVKLKLPAPSISQTKPAIYKANKTNKSSQARSLPLQRRAPMIRMIQLFDHDR